MDGTVDGAGEDASDGEGRTIFDRSYMNGKMLIMETVFVVRVCAYVCMCRYVRGCLVLCISVCAVMRELRSTRMPVSVNPCTTGNG